MVKELRIIINSNINVKVFEELIMIIRDLLEQKDLEGIIENLDTGNIITTRNNETHKNDVEYSCNNNENIIDQRIEGILTLGEKIWFNDDTRCRLRICGFTKKEIEKLRDAIFIDLTITDYKDTNTGVVVCINEFSK